MKSVQMPEVRIQTTPEAVVVEPSAHVSQGGGSTPGVCGSPAKATDASAQTSSSVPSSFLTVVSPVVEAVDEDGRVPAVTVHCNPITDPDLTLFRTLADRKDFDSLTTLCRERLLTARDGLTSLRWTKDRAIVEALRGNFTAAYDLLASAHFFASGVTGKPRGKYENEFGIVLARLGRPTLALERFGMAYQNARSAGDFSTCAHVDTARARALITRGETQKAMRYITRSLDYAKANDDYRLMREVCDTVIEFEGVLR